jgi:hypothetical protein
MAFCTIICFSHVCCKGSIALLKFIAAKPISKEVTTIFLKPGVGSQKAEKFPFNLGFPAAPPSGWLKN